MVLFIAHGIAIEHWMRQYPFPFSWMSSFIELSVYSAISSVSLRARSAEIGFPDTVPPEASLKDYLVLASTLTIGRSLTYVGLQEVSFPVALMSKSCKLIVVMVGGVLLLGKKYQMRDYLAAGAIVAGLFIFQQDSAKSGSSTFFGILVLLLSLTFDSLNSNYNEKVVSVNRCDVLRVFAHTNVIACIMSAVCVIVSGELRPSLVAFAEQPMCLALLILMNIFLYFAVLQWSYFLKEFGATAAVGIGIGRKFLALLLSFAIYQQQMHMCHIVGIVVFFTGTFVSALPRPESASADARRQKPQTNNSAFTL